jgi:hypothetical protein
MSSLWYSVRSQKCSNLLPAALSLRLTCHRQDSATFTVRSPLTIEGLHTAYQLLVAAAALHTSHCCLLHSWRLLTFASSRSSSLVTSSWQSTAVPLVPASSAGSSPRIAAELPLTLIDAAASRTGSAMARHTNFQAPMLLTCKHVLCLAIANQQIAADALQRLPQRSHLFARKCRQMLAHPASVTAAATLGVETGCTCAQSIAFDRLPSSLSVIAQHNRLPHRLEAELCAIWAALGVAPGRLYELPRIKAVNRHHLQPIQSRSHTGDPGAADSVHTRSSHLAVRKSTLQESAPSCHDRSAPR